MKTKNNLIALAGLALLGAVGNASAATVSCPGTLTTELTRQITVTGALTGGLCAYQQGNFNGDNFSSYFTSYTLVDKDIAPDGQSESSLQYTMNGGRTAGTYSIDASLWSTYEKVFLAWHFGNGAPGIDPDAFIVEIERNNTTGTWALLPENLANGLSNFYLIGTGTSPCTSPTAPGCGGGGGDDDDQDLPEPGSLALLGLGLLGLGVSRRRAAK